MRSKARSAMLVVAALVGALLPAQVALPQTGASAVPGQLIVGFHSGVDDATVAAFNTQYGSSHGLNVVEDLSGAVRQELVSFPVAQTAAIASALSRDPRVAFAEPNFIYTIDATVPNDPRFEDLWGLNNTGQTGGTADKDIDAPEAWDLGTGSAAVIVGVIDTGFDYNHPDLAANIWTNPGEIVGNGLDDDANGYVDDIHGINAITGTGNPLDDQGHGTHVSGTIGAVGNNGVGVAGVNWTVSIAACKFLNSAGSGTTADAVECFNYFNALRAAGLNVLATNNSWGGGGRSTGLQNAMTGVILHAAAAGNGNSNNDATPSFPASYPLDNIIAVAATDHNDAMASFTNWGATSVDLAAPGVNILSTVPTGSCSLCDGSGYLALNGTSMATPHVTGAAALIWSQFPSADQADVKQRILISVDPAASATKPTLTGGRLNVHNALTVTAPANTGLQGPNANAAAAGGDGNGYESNPANAHANGSGEALDNNSGNGTSTSCTSANKDKHIFRDFGISVPGTATVRGIQVRLDARADSTSNSPRICVQLSWNGGADWTVAKVTPLTLATGEATYVVANSLDTWGHTWTADQLSNANFRMRVIDVSSNTRRDFRLDWVAVRVSY